MSFRQFILPAALLATSPILHAQDTPTQTVSQVVAPPGAVLVEADTDYSKSVVRVNVTQQTWSLTQPWDKTSTYGRSALGVAIGKNQILTTAEMASNVVNLELEDVRGIETIPAKVLHIDYGINLAIIAPDTEDDDHFASQLTPVKVASPLEIGDTLKVVQMEDNGMPLVSPAQLQGVDIVSTFAPGEHQLCYEVKASLQSATSSFSVPGFSGNSLVGLLSSYDSEDQLSIFITPETITRFLADVSDGSYEGFPVLGIAARALVNPHFRNYLQLGDATGGVYVTTVKPGSPAEASGLKEGDVITSVGDYALDYRGFYEDEQYGRLFWTNIIRGKTSIGSNLKLGVIRDKETLTIEANLTSRSSMRNLVPKHMIDRAPNFLVKGGIIFQELSAPFLENYGSDWRSKAPLDLLNILLHPERVPEEKKTIVILTAMIPTQATVGYESIRNAIVDEVNGVAINQLSDLEAAFEKPVENHSIKTSASPSEIFVSAEVATAIDQQLLKRGLPFLSRIATGDDSAEDDGSTAEQQEAAAPTSDE